MDMDQFMRIAIEEAKQSLREGNNGFGAVIIRNGVIITTSHDQEDTEHDCTSHAEMNAIREASRQLGKDLSGCQLICTHEPCPMCASAIAWSGINEVTYGYSIKDAVSQNRKRIELPCAEIFDRTSVEVRLSEGILNRECGVLYRNDVRREIGHLRNADDKALSELNQELTHRRTTWFRENQNRFDCKSDLLNAGYRLLLERFGISEKEAPIVRKTDRKIVFHSVNFCPTLEACQILKLDTRSICKRLNETATDCLLKQIDSRLNFTRNYQKLRPYTDYCEEMISIEDLHN